MEIGLQKRHGNTCSHDSLGLLHGDVNILVASGCYARWKFSARLGSWWFLDLPSYPWLTFQVVVAHCDVSLIS